MAKIEAPRVGSVLAVAAHPDDIESWCAGTLAIARDRGAAVRLLLVTSGEHGASDPLSDSRAVGALREAEALAAAQLLGICDVEFLRYGDGEVEQTHELRGDLVRWIRRWRPDVVFTHDPEHPWPPYVSHRDHRVTGRAALDAVYPLARDALAFGEQALEGLLPHRVREVWLFASDHADAHVDIGTGFDRKVAARLAHRSQTADPAALRVNWMRRAADTGVRAGLPLAEAFKIVSLE